MNIAVIGANGFIGRHLVRALRRRSEDRLLLMGRAPSASREDGLEYVQLDFKNAELTRKKLAGTDLVYYLASGSIPSSSWSDPRQEIALNLAPFLDFLEAAKDSGVKKFSFVSSAGTIYGHADRPVNETAEKKPFTPYGITKLAMEYFLDYYKVKTGLQHDIFRVSNVYGPGQDTSKGLGLINTHLENILRKGEITIFGEGRNVRNFIYIADVVKMMLISTDEQTGSSRIFNVASDDTFEVREIATIMKECVPHPFKVVHLPARQSDNAAIIPDNSLIKAAMPEFSFTPIREGILETYNYIREKK